jgi:hypothetical protein
MRYSYLRTFVFLDYDTTRTLAALSHTELAVHQSLTELMSDWSKRQSYGELMTRKIVMSSAKIKNVQWLLELHRSSLNMLKGKDLRTEPCGTPEVT